jgi:hypothetical protein
MIMSHLSVDATVALTRASMVCATLALTSLLLGSGIGAAASATEECSSRYKVCNGGCDRPINAVEKILACKSGCDFRLIACDRQPANASVPDENHSSSPSLELKVIEALQPVAVGSDAR